MLPNEFQGEEVRHYQNLVSQHNYIIVLLSCQ
jgi:hypothetical protein